MPLKCRNYSKITLSAGKSSYKSTTDHQQLKQGCKRHSTSIICLISFQKGKSTVSRDITFEKLMSSVLVSRREFNEDPSLITPLISFHPSLTTGTVLKVVAVSAFEDPFLQRDHCCKTPIPARCRQQLKLSQGVSCPQTSLEGKTVRYCCSACLCPLTQSCNTSKLYYIIWFTPQLNGFMKDTQKNVKYG